MQVVIGTRGSRLALMQAQTVQKKLADAYPEHEFVLKIIKTKGDRIQNVALDKIGDKGLFVKEIEKELLADQKLYEKTKWGVTFSGGEATMQSGIVEELAKENVPLAVGPTLTSASKYELRNKSWTTPGVLAAAGCQVSIITDSPVIPQEYLPLCAGLAVQAGMDPFAALQAITINPARHAGIADRVGSIEVGKDADLVITDGCPFEVSTKVRHVFIEGKEVQ